MLSLKFFATFTEGIIIIVPACLFKNIFTEINTVITQLEFSNSRTHSAEKFHDFYLSLQFPPVLDVCLFVPLTLAVALRLSTNCFLSMNIILSN